MWHNFFMLCLFWCGANSRPFATATVFYFFRQWHGGAHGQLLFFVIHLFSAIVSKKNVSCCCEGAGGEVAHLRLPDCLPLTRLPPREVHPVCQTQVSSHRWQRKILLRHWTEFFFMTIYYLGTPSLSTTCRPSSKSRTGGRSTSEWVLKFWTIRSNI